MLFNYRCLLEDLEPEDLDDPNPDDLDVEDGFEYEDAGFEYDELEDAGFEYDELEELFVPNPPDLVGVLLSLTLKDFCVDVGLEKLDVLFVAIDDVLLELGVFTELYVRVLGTAYALVVRTGVMTGRE